MLTIGCHLSASEGFLAMGKTALSIGANTFQFFTRNPRGSKAKAIDPDDAAAFLALAQANGFGRLVAHAPYTINPCSKTERTREFARMTLADDLKRMRPDLFGKTYVYHTGQCGMAGINELLKAGMGADVLRDSSVGSEIEAVERLMSEISKPEGLGTYGTEEVRNASLAGAVDLLLILDSKVREQDLDDVVRAVESQKGTVMVVSGQHDGGKSLASLGGMGAILRYKLG